MVNGDGGDGRWARSLEEKGFVCGGHGGLQAQRAIIGARDTAGQATLPHSLLPSASALNASAFAHFTVLEHLNEDTANYSIQSVESVQ